MLLEVWKQTMQICCTEIWYMQNIVLAGEYKNVGGMVSFSRVLESNYHPEIYTLVL